MAGTLTDALGGRFASRVNGHPAAAAATVPTDGRAAALRDAIGEAAFGEPALEDPRAALERARAEAADAIADAEGETRRERVLPGPAGTPGT